MTARFRTLFLIISIPVITILAGISDYPPSFDRWGYDQLNSYFKPISVAENRIVLIDIDAKSIDQYSGWPLSRELHARAVEKLTAAKVASLTYNIVFAQPDLSTGSNDPQLLKAIKANGRVVLPVIAEHGREIYPFAMPAVDGAVYAHADLSTDIDGHLRRSYLWAGMQFPRWPSMALASLQKYAPVKANDHSGLRTPYLHIAFSDLWSRDHKIWLPMGAGSFLHDVQRYRFSELITGQIPQDQLRNKAIFVGISDERIEQKIPVYADQRFFSTEIHAFVFAGLNQGFVLSPSLPVWSTGLGIFSAFCLASVLLLVMPLWARLLFLCLFGTSVSMPLLLIGEGYWISYFPSLVGIAVVLLISLYKVMSNKLKKSPV
ncbi:CHASE2 domain-containing protein [Neptuniibacter caesariensis]|uniref:Probable two-component sensor n=1 Tax=Neptuniibacter caesariensis TaxID=207954 RepID=A0A7U8C2R4_NEPCE|nr:CHASE2 domain-containing protein [Neptuniibacter caesariensis]EAR60420.1 probable two-component sensor [Oceanospirillum sp. MED92] [Neptuniibacter caesariensis]